MSNRESRASTSARMGRP